MVVVKKRKRNIPDFGYSVSVDEGGEAEETSTIGTDTYKVARRTWIFHDGYTYWGKSREKLMVKVSNGVRTWHSITHEEYYKVGGWALGNVEYLSVSVTPFLFEAESAGNATVEARYRVRLTPSVYNQNFDSEYKYSYATWNTTFQKTQ